MQLKEQSNKQDKDFPQIANDRNKIGQSSGSSQSGSESGNS